MTIPGNEAPSAGNLSAILPLVFALRFSPATVSAKCKLLLVPQSLARLPKNVEDGCLRTGGWEGLSLAVSAAVMVTFPAQRFLHYKNIKGCKSG